MLQTLSALNFYHVDAFANTVFEGNPAAVIILKEWLEDVVLQKIASENNLPITTFVREERDAFKVRWFTPTTEADLCGHGSLAAAFIITEFLNPMLSTIKFKGQLGEFTVTKEKELFTIEFPQYPLQPSVTFPALEEILGAKPIEVLTFEKDVVLAVLEREEQVRSFVPSFQRIEELDFSCLGITAPGDHVDFVSRWFAPKVGLPEDYVTGSAHCLLTPFWSAKLKKEKMIAKQVSPRERALICELKGEKVALSGKAVLYLKGEILIEHKEKENVI